MKKRKLSAVSIFHYFRLVYRSLLFLTLLVIYIVNRVQGNGDFTNAIEKQPVIITVICIVFSVEMILRFFPSKLESPGCQKQFARNYIKSGKTDIVVQDNNATVLVLLLWISGNAVFGALHMKGILDLL